MTRHGLQLTHPAITTTLEMRTLSSGADGKRKYCHEAPNRRSSTSSRHRKWAWPVRSAPTPASNLAEPHTPPNPKSP